MSMRHKIIPPIIFAASLICAVQNSYACQVTVPLGNETIEVKRGIGDKGEFSYGFYDSVAADKIKLQYYWKPAPGSMRAAVPVLSMDFKEYGFGKLKVGTNLLLTADDGRQWRIARAYEEEWVDDFETPNADLYEKFLGAKIITAQLMLSKKGRPDKLLAAGTIDFVKLQAEYLALAEADKLLDIKQSDYQNQCYNAIGNIESASNPPLVPPPPVLRVKRY
jgi:hypothetical protein